MTDPAPKPPLVEATWDEFAAAGLFWWINRALHLFGWVLVREVEGHGTPEERIVRVYPARCRFRGFDEQTETDGFQRLTAHLQANVDELVQHTKE